MVDSHHSSMRSLGPDRSEQSTSLVVWFLLGAYDLLFGCHHTHLSRVFTLDRRTYRVCLGCGAKFDYSLDTMAFQKSENGGIHEKASVLHLARFRRALGTR